MTREPGIEANCTRCGYLQPGHRRWLFRPNGGYTVLEIDGADAGGCLEVEKGHGIERQAFAGHVIVEAA